MAHVKFLGLDKQGNRKYRIHVCNGTKPDGKPNMTSTTIRAKSDKDAERQANAYEVDIKRGVIEKAEKGVTFREMTNGWIKDESGNVAEKTRVLWLDYLDNFILPALGNYNIKEMKAKVIRDYLMSLDKDGVRRDGKSGGFSGQTKLHHYHVIYRMFMYGIGEELTEINPCISVKPPKVKAEEAAYYDNEEMTVLFKKLDEDFKREETTWSPLHYDSENGNWDTQLSAEEKTVLRNYVHEMHKFYVRLAYIGLFRRSEMCGIEFGDIDYKNKRIKLCRTSHYSKSKGIYTQYKLKDDGFYRYVVMMDKDMEMLQQFQKLSESVRVIMGDKWIPCDRLFIAVNGGKIATAGGPINPTTITQWFRRALKRYKIKELPLHGLRHSGISFMINKGAPSDEAADRAGNSVAVLEKRYKHIFDETKQRGAERFSDV